MQKPMGNATFLKGCCGKLIPGSAPVAFPHPSRTLAASNTPRGAGSEQAKPLQYSLSPGSLDFLPVVFTLTGLGGARRGVARRGAVPPPPRLAATQPMGGVWFGVFEYLCRLFPNNVLSVELFMRVSA